MAHNNLNVSELTADLPLLDITRYVRIPHPSRSIIGYGTSSKVLRGLYNCQDPNTLQVADTDVAIKQIGDERMGLQEIEQRVKREIAVWRSLEHPNVTQLLGIYHQEGMPPCLVSPLRVRNELLAYIERHPESQLAIARGIAAGTEYLHSNMVVHGDIKADNILVSEFGIAQINDFDMARILGVEGFNTMTWRDARFNAPELLTPGQPNNIPPTFNSDIFSLGILLLQVFHGHTENRFPYNHIHYDGFDPRFSTLVHNGDRPIRDRYQAMSDGHWELLCYCWKGNPVDRPNISRVVGAL